ncbi:hypothetical protein Scel_75960 [Streptomyces cellostaticus]|nr:hypothetical protein Scel_75960 [Streptomyces cellostaticus]
MVTTCVGGGGTFLVTAERPEGPWSDPVWIDLPGIDPDLAWDEDGQCWCAMAGVTVARIDPRTGRVLEGPLPMWSGIGLRDPEAPHLYRNGDWWYLLLAEGGTALGHGVPAARARSPRGPWEAAPVNPLLSHRGTGLPVQCTGHADLVQAAEGSWWMVLPGTRPRGYFPEFHVLGRETFLVAPGGAGAGAAPGTGRLGTPCAAARPGRLHRSGPRAAPDIPAPQARRLLVPGRAARTADADGHR